MGLKRLCGLSFLLLSSCAQKKPDFAPLPPVARIEAKTMLAGSPYGEITKKVSNASEVARIVAAVDAEKSGWQTLPDGPQSTGSDVDLTFYGSNAELRQFTVHPSIKFGNRGGEWNLSALDRTAAKPERVFKKVPEPQIKALLRAIGPLAPPPKRLTPK